MTDLPRDPVGPLATGAASMHEMMLAYVDAGFSRSEAVYLVGVVMAAMIRGPATG